MIPGRDPFLRRLERDTLLVGGALALVAALLWPTRLDRALGVLGGIALMAVSYLGIRAGVESLWTRPEAAPVPTPSARAARTSPPASRAGFVKFFTRHAILAAGAYVMIARFEFDPVAMLAGVTAPAVAGGVELVRTVRARAKSPHSRFS